MISKNKIIEEVLELVDATPLTEIDIKPILDKYSIGLEFNEQRILRDLLNSALIHLANNGYIVRRSSNFLESSGTQWMGSSELITSTLLRKEKLEHIEREKNKITTYQPIFNGPTNVVFSNSKSEILHQTINGNKKSANPSWLTLSFYWNELIKHWFKIVLIAFGGLISLLGFPNFKSKDVIKQNQKQTPIKVDTSQETNSKELNTSNASVPHEISHQNNPHDAKIQNLLKEARNKQLSVEDKIDKFIQAYNLLPEKQKAHNFIESLESIYNFNTQAKLLDSFFITRNYKNL